MKIWYGYGSDHSENLVMIGEFKTAADAEQVLELIHIITNQASKDQANDIITTWGKTEQYSPDMEELLRKLNLYSTSPSDVADFVYLDVSIEQHGNALHFRTDDIDIGGFVKLMVQKGAKVQVFSAHHHPEEK